MPRHPWSAAVLFLAAASALWAGALPPAWKHWRYSAPISGNEFRQTPLLSLLIPAAVMARAERDWRDLRVIDPQGNEVPYILYARPGEVTPLHAGFRAEPAAKGQPAHWRADIGEYHLPVSELRFEMDHGELRRAVRINTSADGAAWRTFYEGHTQRRRDGGEEQLRIALPVNDARYWRVEVDGSPLAGLHLDLWGTPRRVVFSAERGKVYRLLFGNRAASPVNYEMAHRTSPAALDAAPEAALGPEEMNAGWEEQSTSPPIERNAYTPWAAALLAIAVVAALAARARKRSHEK